MNGIERMRKRIEEAEESAESYARVPVALQEALLDVAEAGQEIREHSRHYQAKPGHAAQLLRATNRFDNALARLEQLAQEE
jgi:hypothetical protein